MSGCDDGTVCAEKGRTMIELSEASVTVTGSDSDTERRISIRNKPGRHPNKMCLLGNRGFLSLALADSQSVSVIIVPSMASSKNVEKRRKFLDIYCDRSGTL